MEYSKLVEIYEKLESTTKRLEKTYYISKILRETPTDDLGPLVLLIQGRVFPPWDKREIGIASNLVIKIINIATGISQKEIEEEWKKYGDLGTATEKLISKKRQATLFTTKLTLKKVFNNLRKIVEITGTGSVDRKLKLVAELLTSAKPKEAKYIIRLVLEELRVGAGEGVLRDAITWAFLPKVVGIFFRCKKCNNWMPNTKTCLECGSPIINKFDKEVKDFSKEKDKLGYKYININSVNELEKKDLKKYDFIIAKDEKTARVIYNKLASIVESAYNLTNDFSKVSIIVKKESIKGLLNVKLEIGKPIKVMLYLKAKGIEDAFDSVGKPAALEYKYDGFRMQIHKIPNDGIKLFTRRLEEVTRQFPDVVKVIKNNVKGDSFILDCETIGIDPKTGKWLPFQNISQRIKRKYDIKEMIKKIPVMVNVFDILAYNNKTLIKDPFKKRRDIIDKIIKPVQDKLQRAKQIITSDIKEAEKFYKESLDKGNEGIMVKSLDAIYKPGARVGYGMKVKPVMTTLDLVITGAEIGEGKRAKWFSSFTVACIDPDTDQYLDVGQVGTGIKEKASENKSEATFGQMTESLKPLVISEKGRSVRVKPKIVVEVNYEEIQKSPKYNSGYALRFPRIIRIREDRDPEEISTIGMVEQLYKEQRHRSEKQENK